VVKSAGASGRRRLLVIPFVQVCLCLPVPTEMLTSFSLARLAKTWMAVDASKQTSKWMRIWVGDADDVVRE
jgi:hypothetical protein